MKVLVYLRMSQDRDGDELGITRQREDCLALVAQRGWTLLRDPLSDNDRSASGRKPRPEFQRLLQLIGSGEVGAVVAWSIDRLTRNARDRLSLVEVCQAHNVIISLARGSDIDCSTPSGRLVAGLMGEVAQHEIDQKADRQRRANQQAAEQGRRVGGRWPFGYTDKGMVIVPAEAKAIRDGYHYLLAGLPLAAIAARWNEAGHRTRQTAWRRADRGTGNSVWRADSVRRALLNPRYAGIRAHKGVEVGPAVWPPIVEIETLRAAQAVLRDASRSSGGAGSMGQQLLTGIALCGNELCGQTMHGGGASHGKPIYRCASDADKHIEKAPGRHPSRLAEPIDLFVSELVIARLSRKDARELLVDEQRPDVPALRQEANQLRARFESVAAEFAEDAEVSLAEYRVMTRSMREQLAAVEEQLADAGRVDVLGELVRADDVAAAWELMERSRRRAVISELVTVRILTVGRGVRTFRPESVDTEWKTVTGS